MISLNLFLEHRITDSIKIFNNGRSIIPLRYAYDKDSLDELVEYMKTNIEGNELRICKLNGNRWNILKDKCKIDNIKITKEFLTVGNKPYTYEETVDILDDGKYMLIIINGNN